MLETFSTPLISWFLEIWNYKRFNTDTNTISYNWVDRVFDVLARPSEKPPSFGPRFLHSLHLTVYFQSWFLLMSVHSLKSLRLPIWVLRLYDHLLWLMIVHFTFAQAKLPAGSSCPPGLQAMHVKFTYDKYTKYICKIYVKMQIWWRILVCEWVIHG